MIMKTKQKTKQPKFKQDRLYEWVESAIDGQGGAFFILLPVFSALSFGIFWLGCVTDSCTNTNNIPMMVGYFLSFFIILELIYIWICKNEKDLDEYCTVPFKLMSFILTCIIMNIIVPSLYGIYILLKDYLINLLLGLGGVILIVVALISFYYLNKAILIYIKESRKTR